ncbi:hypothetical protein Tco_0765198 [Tanacetum coccineum]
MDEDEIRQCMEHEYIQDLLDQQEEQRIIKKKNIKKEPALRDIDATVENEQDGNLMEAEVVDVVAHSQDIAASVENQGQVVDVAKPS